MPPEVPPPAPSPRRRLWLRRSILFGLLPLAVLAGLTKWGIAPWFVRRHISKWFAERSYARLEIKWASVGVHEIRLYGVSLTDRAGRVYGTADKVIVRLDRPIVGSGKPGIESLRVVRPDVTLTLDPDGHFDLQKLLKRPPEAPPRSPKPMRLPPTFDIEGGLLHFKTAFLKTTFGTIDAPIHVLPNRYEWKGVQARALGGRASLSGFIGREGEKDWSVQINVADASVSEMSRGTTLESKRLEGRLNGFLSLARGGDAGKGAIGAGWIDIEQGKLLELPVLLSVFNVLRLGLPGDSVVTACRTDFRVLDDRLHFDRFYLLTAGICLFGDGDILHANHQLELNFIPRLIGELPVGVEDVREAINPATDFFSKNLLLAVVVKGTWTEPIPLPLPVPVATKPFADLLEWVLGKVKEK
ncbi:MAG: hypothetical protein FD180_3314 [Planctomycetota bacterium]|nr:MAG: hypothetical protein FD180_3314 [Planctomycetota bacterium]